MTIDNHAPENKPLLIDANASLVSPPQDIKNKETFSDKQSSTNSRSKLLWGFTLLIFLIAIFCFLVWFFYFRFHETTDDAYSNGNMVNINATVPGSVISFYCDNTQLVKQGQLLVSLDPTEAQIALNKELATLAHIVLEARQLYNAIEVSEAKVESKQALLSKAKFDFENRLFLHESHPLSVSNEDFIHSRDDYTIAQAEFKLAEKELQSAKDAAGNTSLIEHPIIQQQKANVKNAFFNLQHCSIYAPVTGYVAQRNVEVGQRVSSQMNLLAIIPADYIWVDANFKETQLTYMRVGQLATISFDMYGSKVIFEGKVLGIASGTGSIFSLIPPQNATGNWIKIVQRLPVRIGIDARKLVDYPIRLGISAEVDVDITNQNLPRLVEITQTSPIATTRIFDLDWQIIEDEIERVIRQNLKAENLELLDGK